MSKIRKLYYFDKKSTQEMISFLNNNANDTYINRIMFNPFIPLHHLLPLSLKFLPESYILKEKKEIKGLITVAPVKCHIKKIEIQKLFFEENALEDAAELVQYVVSKYKAMGAFSIIVKVDDYLTELLHMFTSKCGFTHISEEKLWRINNFSKSEYDKKVFRPFRNTDASAVAEIYNNSLLPHFRPLLSINKNEFLESIFAGLAYYSEYKYVIEDKNTAQILACISIRTSDNENYITDIIMPDCANINIDSVLAFVSDQIHKRKKRFGLFIRTKKYITSGERTEELLKTKGYEPVQSQIVLTNSSARVLKNPSEETRYTVFSNFCPSNGIPT